MGESSYYHRLTHKHRSHTRRHKGIDDQHDTPPTPIVTITPSQDYVAPEEKEAFKELNKVDERDKDIPKATIVNSEPDQNKLRTHSLHDDDASTSSASSSENESSSDERSSFSSQIDLLSEELKNHDDELQMEYDKKDKKLMEATEYNRHVPSPDFPPTTIADNKAKGKNHLNKEPQSSRAASSSSAPSTRSHRHLVFTEPKIDEQLDRIVVTQYYGESSPEHKSHQKPRTYLVAYDFSKESRSAVEWTMGTILRDHDEIYVVTAVSEDEDSADSDKDLDQVLHDISSTLNTKSKILLGHMLLFDIKLVTITIRGPVREVLETMMDELPSLTMVVSGCRGRSTMKGMLMGSVSTFLLHKSPAPVTVIRYQKKKKRKSKRKSSTHAHALSESIKTNHLVVDELSTTGASR